MTLENVMAKRILVPVERTREMELALRVVRMIARESGGVVRLLAVIPIPKAVCDNRDWVVVTTDQQMDRLASAAADDLSRMAALALDGVPVETSVIFGDRAVEIGMEAECFQADLVVVPFSRRPSPAAWIRRLARRLFAGRSNTEFDVLSVSALRAEGRG
jgi:nucleotide-binding universal stress UspA family protein